MGGVKRRGGEERKTTLCGGVKVERKENEVGGETMRRKRKKVGGGGDRRDGGKGRKD